MTERATSTTVVKLLTDKLAAGRKYDRLVAEWGPLNAERNEAIAACRAAEAAYDSALKDGRDNLPEFRGITEDYAEAVAREGEARRAVRLCEWARKTAAHEHDDARDHIDHIRGLVSYAPGDPPE